ncbi:MAG: SGNH/GDSL hydrolase family protein [Acidobacteriota bacterium]
MNLHRLVAVAALIALPSCRSSHLSSASISPHSQPRLLGSGEPLTYLVLGDSTAVAEGGDYEQGLAVESARHLADRHQVTLVNLGISGATAHDVLTIEIPRARSLKPDVVLVDVGSNDVTHLTSARSVQRDLGSIVTSVLALNCEARVVITGAADMGSPPRIPFLLRGIAAGWSRHLNVVFKRTTAERQLTFAPIAEKTGPQFRRDRTLFSEDRFHPNDRGYALWTSVVNTALDEALASQPAHCPK